MSLYVCTRCGSCRQDYCIVDGPHDWSNGEYPRGKAFGERYPDPLQERARSTPREIVEDMDP